MTSANSPRMAKRAHDEYLLNENTNSKLHVMTSPGTSTRLNKARADSIKLGIQMRFFLVFLSINSELPQQKAALFRKKDALYARHSSLAGFKKLDFRLQQQRSVEFFYLGEHLLSHAENTIGYG